MRCSNDQFENYEYLNFATVAVVDNYFWAAATNFNALYRINRKTYEAEEMAIFDDNLLGMELYLCAIIHVDHRLFIIPGRGSNIAVYDMNSKAVRYLYAKDKGLRLGNKFGAAIESDRYIYLFPRGLEENYIFKIDTFNESVTYLAFTLTDIMDGERADRFSFGIKCEDYALIALGNKAGIAKFDLVTEELEIINLEKSNSGIIDVCKYEDKVFVLDWNGNLTESDLKTYEQRIWTNPSKTDTYSRIVCTAGKLWLLPLTSGKIVRVMLDNHKIDCFHLPDQLCEWFRWGSKRAKVLDYLIDNSSIYLWPSCMDAIVIIDSEKEEISYQRVFTNKKKSDLLKRNYANYLCDINKSFWLEGNNSLREFIKIIALSDSAEIEMKAK